MAQQGIQELRDAALGVVSADAAPLMNSHAFMDMMGQDFGHWKI